MTPEQWMMTFFPDMPRFEWWNKACEMIEEIQIAQLKDGPSDWLISVALRAERDMQRGRCAKVLEEWPHLVTCKTELVAKIREGK